MFWSRDRKFFWKTPQHTMTTLFLPVTRCETVYIKPQFVRVFFFFLQRKKRGASHNLSTFEKYFLNHFGKREFLSKVSFLLVRIFLFFHERKTKNLWYHRRNLLSTIFKINQSQEKA